MYRPVVVRRPEPGGPGLKRLKQGGGAPKPLLYVHGGGAAQFPDHPAVHLEELSYTVHPIWAGHQGQRLGMTRSDCLSQHLGAVGPKCAVTGGGTAGRLHSKPLGFSTQPAVQPVKGMLAYS